MEEKYKVLVQTNEQDIIININSSAFVKNADGWITVDEGIGDKYHHAQNNYLEKPLYTIDGGAIVYNYKLVGGEIVERTKGVN